MSGPDLVRRRDEGGVAWLTLDRPDKGNALSEAMLTALERRLGEVAVASGIRVVVLGAAGRLFCVGHDLAELRDHRGEADYAPALFARCSRLMAGLGRLGKPVIAMVQGPATAAGCQLVASCDLAYAAETARFAVSGINLGLFCATPAVALSRVVPVRQALEMLLTGDFIPAAKAAAIGLVNEAVPAEALAAKVARMAARIAGKPGRATVLGKEMFYAQAEMDLGAAYAYAGARMAENLGFAETEALIDGFLDRRR